MGGSRCCGGGTQAHTGNKPTRSDKEHLRRLYIRYYKLKCCVVKHAGADPRHADDATQASHDSERVRSPSGSVLSVTPWLCFGSDCSPEFLSGRSYVEE
jgi:hypothetical protein